MVKLVCKARAQAATEISHIADEGHRPQESRGGEEGAPSSRRPTPQHARPISTHGHSTQPQWEAQFEQPKTQGDVHAMDVARRGTSSENIPTKMDKAKWVAAGATRNLTPQKP